MTAQEHKELAYVVEVVPPMVGDAVFEVEEPTWEGACLRARRYRQRGWGAAVSASRERPRWWHVWGTALPGMGVRARSTDCALAQARRVSRGYDAVRPIEVG